MRYPRIFFEVALPLSGEPTSKLVNPERTVRVTARELAAWPVSALVGALAGVPFALGVGWVLPKVAGLVFPLTPETPLESLHLMYTCLAALDFFALIAMAGLAGYACFSFLTRPRPEVRPSL